MREDTKEKEIEDDKTKESENIIINYDPNLDIHSKRSYSCKVNEQAVKKFSGCEEIKLNILKKLNFLKTPKLKPKKGKLNPIPINIGNAAKKGSRFQPLNDDDSIDKNIFNDIISEGEKDLSHKDSSASSSDSSDKEEAKDNIDIKNDNIKNNIKNNNNSKNNKLNKVLDENDEYALLNLHSESKIYSLTDLRIKEENEDEFDEKGDLMLKNMRRKMFHTKKTFIKNDRDYFDIMNKDLNEKSKKYKEDILTPKKQVNFHNTISFTKPKNTGTSILEFLRKNSSIDQTNKTKFSN